MLENGEPARTVSLSQSFVVNPTKCYQIRKALTDAFGEACKFPRRGASKLTHPMRWNERVDGSNVVFSLNAEAGEFMQNLAPNRVPTFEFLSALTKTQLDLFIEASILGDGHSRKKSHDVILGQKTPKAIDVFHLACIMAGYSTSVFMGKFMKKYGYAMTYIRLRKQEYFKICKGKHTRLTVEGIVWCPTTENKTWLAKRNGKVYFTGNCGWGGEDHAAMRAMDTLYAPHKTLPGYVLHIWHPMIGSNGVSKMVSWKDRRWEGQSDPTINSKLSWRYYHAYGKPVLMRKLVSEPNHGNNAHPQHIHKPHRRTNPRSA